MNIVKDFIPAGMLHRPMTNPRSSLYQKKMKPRWITIHNAWSRANAERLHQYVKGKGAESRPASWHFSVDEEDIFQALPLSESGWHAGDNLGPGNTETIGIEICDYAMQLNPPDPELFWAAVDNTAKLCAWLIENEHSLVPFPDCLKQHHNWSGKNCPHFIRAEPGGWEKFIALVGHYLGKKPGYRVIVGSNTDYWTSKARLEKVKWKFPTLSPEIVLNEVDGVKYYRVVLEELGRRDHAVNLVGRVTEKGIHPWIVQEWEDLEFEPPEKEPGKEAPKKDKPEDDDCSVVSLMKLLSKNLPLFERLVFLLNQKEEDK